MCRRAGHHLKGLMRGGGGAPDPARRPFTGIADAMPTSTDASAGQAWWIGMHQL